MPQNLQKGQVAFNKRPVRELHSIPAHKKNILGGDLKWEEGLRKHVPGFKFETASRRDTDQFLMKKVHAHGF